ncbi:putative transposase, Ptta/En/Spm, plant [Helianthus annuus]|nr:putative transposase, Ptta/En/Spm, plant [Helianthus annuus]KAJ0783006.1 putative transposase, Ptta/En/Spm, plant [Helianthus annuus]KAJ0947698.1 putative transposase, Ptta/En/Spm, plant [Helianthus annuus]
MNCGKDNVAHCGGSGGGRGRGGGDGGGRGLRGGKIKKVVSRRIDSDIVVDLNLRRGESDVANVAYGKGRSKKSDPKNANKKTHVDKSSVWTHGPYVVIRSPEGKTMAYRRFGAGGCSQVDEGDQMADVAGMSDNIALSHDVSRDIVNDDNDFDEDFSDGDNGDGSDDGGDSDGGIGDKGVDRGVDGGGDDGGDNGGKDGGGDDGGDGDGGDGDGSEKEFIKSNGKKYTKYRWNRGDDQLIYDTFINMLKRRFRDIMRNLRQKSKKRLLIRGIKYLLVNTILLSNVDFHQMGYLLRSGNGCVVSGTLKNGKKKSEAGKSNRKNDLCIHTGGSIGFDEHRANMEKKEGKKVGYMKVFFQTHATKKCKKRVQDGEIDENDFENLKSRTRNNLTKMYLKETECDDLAIWESLNPKRKGGNLFGVGTSDPHFVVTGTPSSTTYASYDDARQSQEVSSLLLFF